MYIEDLIDRLLSSKISLSTYDAIILNSFNNQLFVNASGLTEKQGTLALRILERYSNQLSVVLNFNVKSLLENPQFKIKLRKSIIEYSVNIFDRETIVVKFPFNEQYIKDIRRYRNVSDNILWSPEKVAWTFPLNEDNIQFIMKLCDSPAFEFDEDFTKYASECDEIINNMENHLPTLAVVNGKPTILNALKNLPEINTDDIIEAVFQARKFGIYLWTDDIETYLNSNNVSPQVRDFLRHTDHTAFNLSIDENDISCLGTVIKYLSPTLFVIPGGMEFDKLKYLHSVLSSLGLENKSMSVLFRLSAETGRNFNEFIRNQGLNEPISEETKIVFVSGKLPKPLIKSKKIFHSVVNLGFDNAHYTLKNYLLNHPNLIYFNSKKNLGSI